MIERRDFLKCCAGCAAAIAIDGLHHSGVRAAPVDEWTRSVCDLCGLGEPVFIGTREGKPAAVKGIPNSTIGFGRLCPRSQALWSGGLGEQRALQPLIRRDPATKGTLEGLMPATWDEALQAAAGGLARVRERLGPSGLAFFASDGETNETYHLLSKVARGVFGTDHVDTPARLDAFGAADACLDVFGVPGNAASLEDVDAASLIILVGGDVADSHPALFTRVLDARRNGRANVVVIDARKTLAAGAADLHLRPMPGGELAIVNALARALLAEARIERLRATDRIRHQIEPLEALWNEARSVTTIVGPTVLASRSGSVFARAVAQLHRATGQWGRPGTGCLFLPKGANASGVVTLGIAPGRLPGLRSLTDADERERVATWWDVEPERMPRSVGLPATSWPRAIENGDIGAMIVLRANPAVEMPNASAWREALRSAFVVSAATHSPSETGVYADVVLPLALVTGESDGTMMTLERRCQLLERAADPPGEARSASEVLVALARGNLDATSHDQILGRYQAGPHVAWGEWQALSRGTECDASGITITRLRETLGIKWPCPAENDPGLERIGPESGMAVRAAADGSVLAPPTIASAKPFVETSVPTDLPRADDVRPFLLVGGPIREHFRSRMRTGRCDELHYEAPVARIEMNPADGSELGIPDGEWVTLESETGRLTARVWLTDRSPRRMLFIPEHFGFLSDTQGGSDTVKEPEGLFQLVASDGPVVAVQARKARRRDMRRRGLSG